MRRFSILLFSSFLALPMLAEEKPVYSNDLEKIPEKTWPEEFFKVAGEFVIAKDGENHVIELPGDPVESFAMLFGASEADGICASLRVFGTRAKRNAPTFGVGINGASGFVLRVSPNKDMLEIAQEDETKASAPFKWKSGTWTWLKIQSRAVEGKWIVEGKAWQDGEKEPEKWLVALTITEKPSAGRPSLFGAPYAGTPIRYDDLKVEKAK